MNAPRFIQLMIVKGNVKKKLALRDIGDYAEMGEVFFYQSNSCEFIHENIAEEGPAHTDLLKKENN